LLHVEVRATEAHVVGEVTEPEVYDVHEAPFVTALHAPDAAQPEEQELYA
jgi:hypothetical protein